MQHVGSQTNVFSRIGRSYCTYLAAMSEQIWQVAYEASRDNHILWWDLPPEVSNRLSTALRTVNQAAPDVTIVYVWQWGNGSQSRYIANVSKMYVQNMDTKNCRALRQIAVTETAVTETALE